MRPDHNDTPKIANIKKKKSAKPKIPPNCETEERSVPISSFMEGKVVRLLSGRNSLKVRSPDIFCIEGSYCNNDVITTIKSSQFHESLK